MGRGQNNPSNPRNVLLGARKTSRLLSPDDPRATFISDLIETTKKLNLFFSAEADEMKFEKSESTRRYKFAQKSALRLKELLDDFQKSLRSGEDNYEDIKIDLIKTFEDIYSGLKVFRDDVQAKNLIDSLDNLVSEFKESEGRPADYMNSEKKKIEISRKELMIPVEIDGKHRKLSVQILYRLGENRSYYPVDDIDEEMLYKFKKLRLVSGPYQGENEYYPNKKFKDMYAENREFIILAAARDK